MDEIGLLCLPSKPRLCLLGRRVRGKNMRGLTMWSARIALAGCIAFGLGLAVGTSGASAGPLPLPPGEIVKGTVYKQPFQCPPDFVPQIENGADANAYILRIATNAFLRSWRACSHGGD